jgi:hypothetical protein
MSEKIGADRKRTFGQTRFTLVAGLVTVAIMGVVEEVPVLRNGRLALVGG